ncbi:N-glycosylase/DNA lyase [Plectosphaerella cucumerina]|uniref:DNA-(apurinic or apyrimidinic site) lyase n=1 Tax=Plectosphaerella cucumerina TaxID=40658 RepID=A0A8K0X9N4_9PEZI|nr:N-glycosylase/DNA lyase [Plectosphaerella cucumerina]
MRIMSFGRVSEWRKFPLSLTELSIDTTLRCGQSFRWRQINDEWNCALHGRVLSLRQDPTHLHYRVTWPGKLEPLSPPPSTHGVVKAEEAEDDTEELLRHYLSLKLDLGSLYEQWSLADPNFKRRAPKFEGVRILSQDAWETLISFICSSNNNIARISQMVHKLCLHYGPLIGHVGDEAFHDFPPPEALTGPGVETHLRELGFGYRAKYIARTAIMVAREKPRGWLDSLANPASPNFQPAPEAAALPRSTYKEAHEQLLQLTGVGPKVADCVCLMGLGWGEAVPVDTHVWQIALRDYKFAKGKGGKTATLSKGLYDAVGDHFRGLWGEYAGWAHSVLFTADLKAFADREPGRVKKEEGEVVVVKKEVEVEEVVLPMGTKRKATRVKVEVKMEEAEVEAVVKRRRTRSQKT